MGDAGQADLRDRLGWFVRLRWLVVAGAVTTAIIARFVLSIAFNLALASAVVAWIAAYNAALLVLLRRRGLSAAQMAWMARAQVGLDLVSLAFLLYVTGGIDNPFSYYFVFHAAIAAIMLPGRESLIVTSAAVLLYGAMVTLEHLRIIPHLPLTGLYDVPPFRNGRYLAANLVVFSSTLYVVRYLVFYVSRNLSRLTAELTEANDALRLADRRRMEEVSLVAHELRSPMAAADTLLETVTGGYVDKTCTGCRSQPILERVRQRIKGSLKLSSDVLDLEQLELGNVRLEQVPIRLDRAVAEAVDELSHAAAEGQVTVEQSGLTELPEVFCDAQSLRFIVANLVANAVKYNRPGGSVMISGRRHGEQVEFRVADTGVGIPAEDLPRVFDIFYRGSYARPRQRTGAGLGLSLVKRLVQAHGGSVGVESASGAGSVFTVNLPVAPEPWEL
jgi:signal transduction histidine kinase